MLFMMIVNNLMARDYKKKNGCTKQWECQQIFWGFSFVTLVTMYSVFVVPPIFIWHTVVGIAFMAILYFSMLMVLVHYIYLTCYDPVDPHVKEEPTNSAPQEKKPCSACGSVYIGSYHCNKCQRCTRNMDHHSLLINNCISVDTFRHFLSMELFFILLSVNMTTQCVVLFIISMNNAKLINAMINNYVVLAIGIAAFIGFVLVLEDFGLSLYIRYYRKDVRINYMYRESESNNSQIESSEKISSSAKSVNLREQ